MAFPDASLERALVSAVTQVPNLGTYASLSRIDHLPWVSHAASIAESGYPQVLTIVVSLLWMSFRLLHPRYSRRVVSQHKASRVRWQWELCSFVSRVSAFVCLFIAAAKGQTPTLNAVCIAYSLIFGILRLVNDLEWRHIALHQINFTVGSTTAMLAMSTILPCVEARQQCIVSVPVRGALASLALSSLIALITPREWVPPSLISSVPESVLDRSPSPEETCSWAGYFLTYDWLTPLIWKGSRTQVTIDDLPSLAWYDDPRLLLTKVQEARAKGKSTFWTTLRLVREEAAIMACCTAAAYTFELIAPFALYNLLSYLADPHGALIRPWVWLLLMFCGPLSRSVVFQQYVFTSTRLIVRVKSSMTQELYHRAMFSMELDDEVFSTTASPEKNKKKAAQATNSAGRLANLMAADVDAIFGARDVVMILVGVPTGTIASLVGMYKMLGWPSLVGAFVLIFTSPISLFIGQKMVKATSTVRKAQDTRISLVSEYLSSIRAIKYFAWEDAVISKIQAARGTEQRQLWRVTVLYVCLNQIIQLVPFISLLLTFSLYVGVEKKQLTAATAFTTVFLVKNIRKNITQAVSLSRRFTAAAVAIKRLDKYFASTIPLQQFPVGPLTVREACFRRTRRAAFTLRDVSIDFADGGLNVVAGPSGSGKTTLLLSILGEAELLSGSVTRPRDVAFASQTTWLQNESVRGNILFRGDYEEARYDAVMEACCLRPDVDAMPQGDSTVVGENGASLSGGQKARVALARALYSKAPLLLLDDVFSALDAKTSALLWERCFCTDMLRGRTVVLVAQQPWIAEQADVCVHLDEGCVTKVDQNIGITRRPIVSSKVVAGTSNIAGIEVPSSPSSNTLPNIEPAEALRGDDIVSQEMRESGKSARLLFFKYMTYFGSPMYAIFCILVMVLMNCSWIGGSLWLSVWVEAYSREEAVNIAFYLGIYALFALGESVGYACVILVFENGAWRAARRLHNDFLSAVMNVSLSWYKRVPVGRVINRFSRDMYAIDSMVCGQLQRFLDSAQGIIFRLAAISSILPIFVVPAAVTCFVGVVIGELYTRTAVTVKKLVSSAQSPVFTQFSDTLAGLAIIRAREGMPEAFGEVLADRLSVWSRAAEANYNCNRWVAMRIDFITALVALCAGMIAVSKAGVVAAGLVGFSLTNATGLSSTILAMVRSMNDLEVELQSFVRVREYASLEPEEKGDKNYSDEGNPVDDGASDISAEWPTTGKVEFRNVTVRYDLDGPDILTDVSLTFDAGERVAVIGRTGSGKSTLILSLLRFTHIVSGQILYDGVDVAKMSRRRLREGLTIIPQEAVLFNGTVGSNLDPTGRTPETRLEKVLASCQDIASFQHKTGSHAVAGEPHASSNGNGHVAPASGGLALTTQVTPKGENFSHGQRQVLSLCRALVRESKLMLLDEATASMDYETDKGVQTALRQGMDEAGGDRTLVTIAHRLRTVIDYDKIVVMSGGRVVESGRPKELYEARGVFHDMVTHSGEGEDLKAALEHM